MPQSQVGSSFGIVAERFLRRISFFNPNTLKVTNQLNLGFDFEDVAITRNCGKAVVTSFTNRTLVELNTQVHPPKVDAILEGPTPMEDVDFTPDGRYAVIVDGGAPANIYSYSLRENKFISIIPTDAQAVAVSPKDNGLVLTARRFINTVRRFQINSNGTLIDTGQEIFTGSRRSI